MLVPLVLFFLTFSESILNCSSPICVASYNTEYANTSCSAQRPFLWVCGFSLVLKKLARSRGELPELSGNHTHWLLYLMSLVCFALGFVCRAVLSVRHCGKDAQGLCECLRAWIKKKNWLQNSEQKICRIEINKHLDKGVGSNIMSTSWIVTGKTHSYFMTFESNFQVTVLLLCKDVYIRPMIAENSQAILCEMSYS